MKEEKYCIGDVVVYGDNDNPKRGKITGVCRYRISDGNSTKEKIKYYVGKENGGKTIDVITQEDIIGNVVKNKPLKEMTWYKKGDNVLFRGINKTYTGRIEEVETDAGGDYLVYCFQNKKKMWIYPHDIIKKIDMVKKECEESCPGDSKKCSKAPKKKGKEVKKVKTNIEDVIKSFDWLEEADMHELLDKYADYINKKNYEQIKKERQKAIKTLKVGDIVRDADAIEMYDSSGYGVVIGTEGKVGEYGNDRVTVMYADGMIIDYYPDNAHEIEHILYYDTFYRQITAMQSELEKIGVADLKIKSKNK